MDDFPCRNHVTDVTEDNKYVENRVYVRNLFEAVQYGSGDAWSNLRAMALVPALDAGMA